MAAEITYLAALSGGAISFLSPCVLPLVPAYLSFVSGRSLEEMITEDTANAAMRRDVMISAMAFVMGFTVVFVALGASASAVSGLLLTNKLILGRIAGVVIALFGLHFLGLFKLGFINREARFHPPEKLAGPWGSFVIGLAFAFGWTPCIGPILAGVLAIAARSQDLGSGIMLLAVYSLGLGLPFLLAAFGMERFLEFFQRFRRHLRKVEIGAGLLLIITGALIFFGSLERLGFYLLETFPIFERIG